ncbi:hypothetical protein J5N97_020056 [Dioscorea zingiberensis]|uniref:Thioredoxin domain-containing protein n=1 Tax=Dioscorea zingiberensis TaxID=325984 RepID=A0A9D5CF26_9LILI|nr:hypothetical protein J5N97_020056 [Dioscorea zingiberensis]
MALESCFQVSTIASSITLKNKHLHPPFNQKLKLPSKRGITISNLSNPLSVKGGSVKTRFQVACQAKSAVDEVLVVTDENWNQVVVGSESPVLVEFWAPWCGPCKMIAPVIEEIAKEFAGKIACCKVNTDDCPNVATNLGIRSIPTVLIFKNGERKECIVGAVPKSTLCTTLEKYFDA